MIKVCHLISCLLKGDGPSNGILAQIAAQDKDFFHSSVWSLYPPPRDRDPRVSVTEAGAGYKVFTMGASFLDARILIPLVRQLKQERPDILHCHLVRANLYGRIAAKMAGIPVVISTLRNIEEYMQRGDSLSRTVCHFERVTARWVSKYIAVSEAVRQEAIKRLHLPPTKIVTILNAIDLTPYSRKSTDRATVRTEMGIRPDDIVVSSVGRLHPQKNYPFFLKTAEMIRAKFPSVRFVIIGDGKERPALESMIADLGLQDAVLLPGFRPDIPHILQAFDIFVLPSLYEGLSRALMEAMAAGLPCVVTDVGGDAEAVVQGKTGFVLPAGDEEGFTSSLETLLRNPDLRRSMGSAARERAHKLFDAKRMANQYKDLYLRLLEYSPQ